jgi:hypothetical protein
MAQGFNFGGSARRSGPTKHFKEIFRRGLNATSGGFTAGSKVRFKHSPGGRR